MKIAADRDRCIGSGNCVFVASEVFDQDEEQARVLLRTSSPPDDLRGRVEDAISGCPVRALSLVDESV
jgi:ferredoxin